MLAVASLRLVSSGAATDGVTYFPLQKTDDLFSHRTLQSDRPFLTVVSSPLPVPTFRRRLSSDLSKFSHKKLILVGCHPLKGVTQGGPRFP